MRIKLITILKWCTNVSQSSVKFDKLSQEKIWSYLRKSPPEQHRSS